MEGPVKGEWWVKTFTGQWPLSMAIWAWAVPVKCTWGIFSTTCTRHSLSNTPFSPSLCLLFLISTRLYRQKQAKILVKIYSKYIGCQLKQRRCCITPCYRYLSQLYHLKNWIFIKKILTNMLRKIIFKWQNLVWRSLFLVKVQISRRCILTFLLNT